MRKIGASRLRNRLRQLLDLVGAGEEVVITRRGRVVARFVPPSPVADSKNAALAILAMSRGVVLGGLKVKRLIADGPF